MLPTRRYNGYFFFPIFPISSPRASGSPAVDLRAEFEEPFPCEELDPPLLASPTFCPTPKMFEPGFCPDAAVLLVFGLPAAAFGLLAADTTTLPAELVLDAILGCPVEDFDALFGLEAAVLDCGLVPLAPTALLFCGGFVCFCTPAVDLVDGVAGFAADAGL